MNPKHTPSSFLTTWDLTTPQIKTLLRLSARLKARHKKQENIPKLSSGIGISWFRDQSTRTRYSFAAACDLLGLSVNAFDESTSQIKHGETILETVNMISFLTEVIGIRDDIYIGLGHSFMKSVEDAIAYGIDERILPKRPTIINLQSDVDHPTQSLSDLQHLIEHCGSVDKLKGKKLVMSWAYSPSYGKPLSVPQGVIGLMTRFGMNVTLAHPPGYDLLPEVLDIAKKQTKQSGGAFEISHDMASSFKHADIVYPKSWAPLSIMKKRVELYKNNDMKGLGKLEKQGLAINAKFKDWECTEERMKQTRNGHALYMHCLPADISTVSCTRGEVSHAVFEQYKTSTYLQARNKPFIIAAMILMARGRSV